VLDFYLIDKHASLIKSAFSIFVSLRKFLLKSKDVEEVHDILLNLELYLPKTFLEDN